MPDRVTFIYKEYPGRKRITVSLFPDGSYKEHSPFSDERMPTVCLVGSGPGPTRKQLDMVERLASLAIMRNPHCVLEFGENTSPWVYDLFTRQLGDDFVKGFAGEGLEWGRKNSTASGPLRSRRKPQFKPKRRK